MSLVVDSSIAACWAMPDESSAIADRALDIAKKSQGAVPALFHYEFRNILLVNERRRRIDATRTMEALTFIGSLPLVVVSDHDQHRLLVLARRNDLTAYDASYLEVALKTGFPLATLDRRLALAARTEGVDVVA